MSEWYPIETAPKDGRELLIFDEFIYMGYWDKWWIRDSGDELSEPTHWMPLPEPPQSADEPRPAVPALLYGESDDLKAEIERLKAKMLELERTA